jgi:putative membrane protein
MFFDRDVFIRATFFNLILMFLLILYTQKGINGPFLFFLAVCFAGGIVVEIIGTKTEWLFGKYAYGEVLGPEFKDVPIIIGLNWFILIYCCGITIQSILTKILEQLAKQTEKPVAALRAVSVIVDGATIALLFDWIMEPVAMDLGYWTWAGGEVPMYNYVSWFVVSCLLLSVFHFSRFSKKNVFAVNLLMIQMMFFLLLRTLL